MVIIIAVPLSLTLLLSNRYIQNVLVDKATAYISEYLDTKVDIGYIEYKIPATVSLNDVYVEDRSKDTLAYIKSLSASVSITKLFQKCIAINGIGVDSARFYLKADSLGNTNMDFIVDNFKDAQIGDVDFTLKAPDIHIKGCKFKFDNTDTEPLSSRRFDPNHIVVDGVDINFVLDYASKDSIAATLKHFTCKEKSGFILSHIGTSVFVSKNRLVVSDLVVKMPESRLSFPDLSAVFDTIDRKNTTLNFELSKSYLSGNDLACFVPEFSNLRGKIHASTHLYYRRDTLALDNLDLSYGTGTTLKAKASLSNLVSLSKDTLTIEDFKNVALYATISQCGTNRADLENTVSDLTRKPFKLPEEIDGFSFIRYNGTISGKMENAKYTGKIGTNAGVIETDATGGYNIESQTLLINGNVGTSDFNFEKIFGKDLKIGKLDFDVNANGTYNFKDKRIAASIEGIVNLFQYNDYDFTGLTLDAIINPDKSIADIHYADKNGNGVLSLDALFDNLNPTKFVAVELTADSVNLGAMRLTPDIPNLKVSTELQLASHFTDIDDIVGELKMDSTTITNNGLTYLIDNFSIDISKDNLDARHIKVISPLIAASIDGKYTLSTLPSNLKYVIAKELSALSPIVTKKKEASNDFTFDVTIGPLTDLAYVFDLPCSIDDTTFISGSFSDYTNYINLNVETEQISLGKNNTIDSVFVTVDTQNDKIEITTDAIFETVRDTTHLYLSSIANDNIVDLNFNFWNTIERDFSGDMHLTTQFFKPKHTDAVIEALCTVHNTELTISDSIWKVNEGTIFFDEHDLIVKNLSFESTNQYLRINGMSNKDRNDGIIKVDMKGVDLSYISEAVSLPEIAQISLLGIASGKVVIGEVLGGKPVLDADVSVEQFGLNGYPIADVNAKAKFNHSNNRIEMYAEALNEKRDTSYMTGYVAPVEQDMQLDIDINELPLGFIEPYLVSFSHEMDGIASGKLSVGGKFDAIEMWGDAYVHDAKLGIDFLGSTFYFADSVHIGRDRFVFPNIHIRDNSGHTGIINGLVTHKYFEKFKYQIDFSIDNTMVLNTNAITSPDFYGTVFASGNAMIVGDENKVDITIAAKPEAGSYFAVPLDSYRSATGNEFITFVKRDTIDHSTTAQERRRKRFKEMAPTTKVNVNIAVEATPDVEAQIIMDSHSGDVIKGRGIGNIKVNVDQNANIKLFGRYDILEGEYNFSLSGAIRKKFEVAENSSITFDGDPMNGMLDINAKYQTTASLTDLLEESLTKDIKNTSVKVNCLAHISGNLLTPKIKFDIDLPGADDEVIRRVKATINTDDMMLQQMVFLLVFGKFYNPQLANAQMAATTSSMATSFATSTISSQLNYWMSQISNNVNLGLNYQDANNGDVYRNNSFEMNVTTNLFNNRLVLYGNLGYRTQYGSTNFVGDVDVEYKLTKSGRFRLKAYNKTNDMLYSTALYTQGLGVMYKETFDTWKNLGKTYKELTRKKTPEEKAEIAKQKEKEKADKAKRKAAKKALKEDRKRRHKEYVEQQKLLKKGSRDKGQGTTSVTQ